MWVVVYVAPNRRTADFLRIMLEVEGIMVRLKETGISETEGRNVEIMVSEVEIEDACEVINNALQQK